MIIKNRIGIATLALTVLAITANTYLSMSRQESRDEVEIAKKTRELMESYIEFNLSKNDYYSKLNDAKRQCKNVYGDTLSSGILKNLTEAQTTLAAFEKAENKLLVQAEDVINSSSSFRELELTIANVNAAMKVKDQLSIMFNGIENLCAQDI